MSGLRWPVVLFDLDGTLVDTIGLIVSSFQHTWRECLDAELDAESARGFIGRTLPDVFAEFAPNRVDELNDTYVTYNKAQLGVLQNSYAGIADLLSALNDEDATLGIVTSKRRATAQMSLDAASIAGVPLLATLEDTDTHKPDPAPLLLALATLGRDAPDAVYIGDTPVDVQAARAAGCAAIAVTWGAGRPDELVAEFPDALVATPAELAAALAC